MTADELKFFDSMPQMLPLYEKLVTALQSAYADMTVKVSKTQISFRSRYIFAMASLPFRRLKGWPKEYLLVSFGLPCKSTSLRVAQAVEAAPNRWTHHVIVQTAEDIDEELMSLINEAYLFSLRK